MAGAYMPGFGLSLPSENKVALATGFLGAGLGGLQVAATRAWDNSGSGAPWVSQLSPNNGEVLNFGTGLFGTILGVIGLFSSRGRGFKALGSHPSITGAIFGYGISTLLFGWLVPMIVRQVSGARARAAYRGQYPPPPTPSGIPSGTSPPATQRNIAVLGALTA